MITDRKISHLRRFLVSNIGLSVPDDYVEFSKPITNSQLKKSAKVATRIESSLKKKSGASAPKK